MGASSNKGKPVHEERDDWGNKLIAEKNGNTITMFLLLAGAKKRKRLGYIDVAKRRFHAFRERGRHIFRKANGYGFNYDFLAKARAFDDICLSDETQSWKIPVAFVLENKKFLHFKQVGFERQVFVSLEQIKPFEMRRGGPAF